MSIIRRWHISYYLCGFSFFFDMMDNKSKVCHVCRASCHLKKIRFNVAELQGTLKLAWRSASIIQLNECFFPCETSSRKMDWYVINELGKTTVIPAYSVSKRTWERAYFISPLDVDWMKFEIHDVADMDYLISAVEILQDMRDLWINDIDTTTCEVMGLFTRFVSALKRMLVYACSVSITA